MTKDLTIVKVVSLVWAFCFIVPLLRADFITVGTKDLPTRPALFSPSAAPQNLSLHSSSSYLHKIINQQDLQLHPQPSKIGASNLHKIFHQLGPFTHFSRKLRKNLNKNYTKDISNINSSLNNGRLKRQLEGIFHVRATPASTIIPILPSKPLNKLPQVGRDDRKNVNRNNTTKTTEKEIGDDEIHKTSKYPSTTTTKIDFTATDIPRAIKDKRNFTVEIVEISRKTLIKQDASDDDDDGKVNIIDSKEPSLQKANFLKPTTIFNPVRPRLTFRKLRRPSQLKLLNDSQNSQTQTTTKETTNKPEISRPVRERKQLIKPQDKSVEIKLNYQEQIPYNERDIDEADLKDYLDGHSTFGAKGDFKHTLSRNVSGFKPNNRKEGHEVYKRTPQPPAAGSAYISRSRARSGQNVNVEQANVRTLNKNPRTTVYAAARPNQVPEPDSDDDSQSVFQYQGNRDKPPQGSSKKSEDSKDPSSFRELFRQGHPGILKAPQPIYKSHPLGEPYGRQDETEDHDNPFRADPLIDDPPLKFDPESDRFYGDPTPVKDKNLAQSNRPEPVRVENQTPEYQEERPSTVRSKNDNNDDRYYYQRDYEPNDYDYEKATDVEDKDLDPYIRDFVSLDSNFERLPRPSAADESFRSLIPPEAEDEQNSRYFDEPGRSNDNRDDGRRTSDRRTESTTDQNRHRNDRQTTDQDRQGNDRQTTDQDRQGNDRQYTRNQPRQQSDDFSDDYSDPKDGFDESSSEPGGTSRDDFDPSYVDALSHFDEEIKRIQENDRRGVTTGVSEDPSTTREPPLVITSPGPVVPYPTRGNAQRPTHSTTPVEESRESEENEEEPERDEQVNRPDDEQISRPEEQIRQPDDNEEPNQGTEKSEEETNEEEPGRDEEEETEEPEDNANEKEQTTSKNTDQESEDKDKDAEGIRQKRMGIKITKSSKNVTTSKEPDKDKSGNLDEDIKSIEKEFGPLG